MEDGSSRTGRRGRAVDRSADGTCNLIAAPGRVIPGHSPSTAGAFSNRADLASGRCQPADRKTPGFPFRNGPHQGGRWAVRKLRRTKQTRAPAPCWSALKRNRRRSCQPLNRGPAQKVVPPRNARINLAAHWDSLIPQPRQRILLAAPPQSLPCLPDPLKTAEITARFLVPGQPSSKITLRWPSPKERGSPPTMRIVLASSEAIPFSKTGGLADVATGLTKALAAAGHHVTLITPHYPRLFPPECPRLPTRATVQVYLGARRVAAHLLRSEFPIRKSMSSSLITRSSSIAQASTSKTVATIPTTPSGSSSSAGPSWRPSIG